jgi:DNA modification methylase
LLAIQKLGWEKCAVDFQDYESEAQEYADMVADNKIAELAEHDDAMMIDYVKINDLKSKLPSLDLLGMPNLELPDDPTQPQCDEDEVPEIKHAISRNGDLWILGNHRLLCGDSTSITDVEKLMDGEKADMVFTDPPYGMDLDTDYSKMPSANNEGNKKYRRVIGDADDFRPELIQTALGVFDYCSEVFMFGADYFAELLPNKNQGSWIVWDKRVTESFDKMIGSAFELCWSKSKHKREIARFNNTLFSGEADARNKVHPTQKPIKLIGWFFEKWGSSGDIVVDLFGGSGSTLIACENTNRKCFMMELDPHYCDVIVARWEKYTGKKAELING